MRGYLQVAGTHEAIKKSCILSYLILEVRNLRLQYLMVRQQGHSSAVGSQGEAELALALSIPGLENVRLRAGVVACCRSHRYNGRMGILRGSARGTRN